MTFCDDLTDLSSHGVEKWTELVVGPEFANASQLGTINYDTIQLDRFDKLTTLMILHQINDLRTNTFDSDPEHSKLNYLKLYGNDIKRIRESTFAAVTLSKLSLVNNNIEYIHKEAFYNCEITTIDLSDNKLEKVEKDVFTEEFLSNVTKEIIIRNNRLEWIESFSFPSSLEILNLDYNKLSTFNYNVFHNLQNLQELTMSHNKLKSLPGLKPLKEIVIIDVSHNELITLTASDFNNLSRLEVLDMSHNKIYTSMVFEKFNFPDHRM
jgi:Leucine-rich repeat (LRR) protein